MALTACMAVVARRAGGAALGALAMGLVLAPPADAHGGSAAFEVLEATEVAPGEVEIRVAVTYESDGEVARGAIVEVVATGPSGEAGPSVGLEREAGDETHAEGAPGGPAGDGGPASDGGPEPEAGGGVGLDEPEAGGAGGGSDATNLVVAGVSGVVGGGLGLWASRRRSARKRAAALAPE